MNTTVVTNKSQAKRLMACGVPNNTADMWWIGETKPRLDFGGPITHEGTYSPAWSLSRLLTDILPKHLDNFPFTKWYSPFLEDEIWEMDTPGELNGDVQLSFNGTNWIVDYDWDGFTGHLPQSQNPIEAVVLAIELLHANGYKFD